jgi:hypothetical protein
MPNLFALLRQHTVYGLHLMQAPPCDMPLVFAPTKVRTRARQPKVSDEQKKLDASHQLTLSQYQKIRYMYPEEVLRAATPDGRNEKNKAKEMVLLRLNIDAFSVHFRHEACVTFVGNAHGESIAKVLCPCISVRVPCCRIACCLEWMMCACESQ